MEAKKVRIPTYLKVFLAVITPFIFTIIAFYAYGVQLSNEDTIYPNIFVEGVDVSGLTRSEALSSLDTRGFEQRCSNAEVTLILPDGSKLVISGDDAGLVHNASEVVSWAYSVGRGRGVLLNTLSYFVRQRAEDAFFYVEYKLNEDLLSSIVTSFTEDYNIRFVASMFDIMEDRIIYTKGAGRVEAYIPEMIDFAYQGLFESFENGSPVEIVYLLPETTGYWEDILNVRDSIFVQVVSSTYDRETNSATESVIGVDFDPIAAVTLAKEVESGKTVTFMLEFTEPECTTEHLDSMLFRDLIAERTTGAGGSANRINNIQLAIDAINGQVLLPGEEFSFNETVGERTAERGFKVAPILASGELQPGIGGGICQVSSTIYASIKPSQLLVTEQRKHGKPVAYLPWGWDATVHWGYIDFKFVNNTEYPLRIEVELEGRSLTARIYGTIIDDFPRAAGWKS